MTKGRIAPAIALCIIALLCLHLTSARNIISNQTYTEQATIELQTGSYYLGVSDGNVTTIMLKNDDETIILDEGDCRRFGPEILCHEEKTSDTQARIYIIGIEAEIEVDLWLNQTTSLSIGDPVTAIIWINNTGERAAEDVLMLLPVPENLTIQDVEGCHEIARAIRYDGRIAGNDSETCTFTLRPNGHLDTKLTATVNYTTFGISKGAESEAITIEADVPIDYNITLPDLSSLEPAEPFTITFDFANNEEEKNLSINELVIKHGQEAQLVSSSSGMHVDRGEITFKTLIEPNETAVGYATFAVPYIDRRGTIELAVTYNFTDEHQRTFTHEFDYQTIELPLSIGIAPMSLSFEALSQGNINISVFNPYTYLTFKGYDAQITWQRLQQPHKSSVTYSRNQRLASIPYEMPDVTADKRETIKAQVTAKTDHAQTQAAEQEFTITITPIKDIAVEQVTDIRLSDGALLVDVYATNNHHLSVTPRFQEAYPQGVFVRGTTQARPTLKPGERTLIYSYEVVVTEKQGPTTFTTNYDYDYAGKYLERKRNVTIDLSPSAQEPITTPTNKTDDQTGEAIASRSTAKPTLLHVIIAASILFLAVIIKVISLWLRHAYTFKVKHKSIIKEYQQLIQESTISRKHKDELADEQQMLRKKIDILEHHLKGYEHHLPEELTKLERQEKKVEQIESAVHAKHEKLSKELETLKQKEQRIAAYEEELKKYLERVKSREKHLIEDKELLSQDAAILQEEQSKLKQSLTNTYKHQQLLADRISHFKAKHASHVHTKIDLLTKRKKEALDYHKQLDREEENIREEFKKLEHDLKISQADLERAEKLYKESITEQGRGETDKGREDG